MSARKLTPEQLAAIPAEYAAMMDEPIAHRRDQALAEKYGVSPRRIRAILTTARRGEAGRPGSKFTKEEREQAAGAYRQAIASKVPGAGAALARQLGVPQTNLATWSAGARKGEHHPPDVRAAAVADYAAGDMTLDEIGLKHGVSSGVIAPWAREAGVPPRGRGVKPGRKGKAAIAQAIKSMNTAIHQVNGKLPAPVITQRPSGSDSRGLIGAAVDELAKRLKLRGARLTKLEYDGTGYVVTYEVTERFDTEP